MIYCVSFWWLNFSNFCFTLKNDEKKFFFLFYFFMFCKMRKYNLSILQFFKVYFNNSFLNVNRVLDELIIYQIKRKDNWLIIESIFVLNNNKMKNRSIKVIMTKIKSTKGWILYFKYYSESDISILVRINCMEIIWR